MEHTDRKPYTYKKKKYLVTEAEHDIYHKLEEAVGKQYHVFPQIHLSEFLDHEVKGQDWRGALSHIQRKSVDYVICTKNSLEPKLAIELDDKSHDRPDRVKRDIEVERILREAGIPLLRINSKDLKPGTLADLIKNYK